MNTTEVLAEEVRADLEILYMPTALVLCIHRYRHGVDALADVVAALLGDARGFAHGGAVRAFLRAGLESVDWPTIYALMDATEYEARLGDWEDE